VYPNLGVLCWEGVRGCSGISSLTSQSETINYSRKHLDKQMDKNWHMHRYMVGQQTRLFSITRTRSDNNAKSFSGILFDLHCMLSENPDKPTTQLNTFL